MWLGQWTKWQDRGWRLRRVTWLMMKYSRRIPGENADMICGRAKGLVDLAESHDSIWDCISSVGLYGNLKSPVQIHRIRRWIAICNPRGFVKCQVVEIRDISEKMKILLIDVSLAGRTDTVPGRTI
jgi:hypothetical protein